MKLQLPPFVFAKAFWEALSFAVSGVLALLVFFQVIPAQYGLSAGALLLIFLAVLKFFGINPELKAKVAIELLEILNEKDEEELV